MVGFARWRAERRERRGTNEKRRLRVLVYWPADQWPEMTERWPIFVDEYGGDPVAHRRALEAMLARHTEEPGILLAVAPVTVAGLLAFAEERELDPAASETRAAYAAELGRQKKATQWPPRRRAACWCGSGNRYEECCASLN